MPLYKVLNETTLDKFNNGFIRSGGKIYTNPNAEIVFAGGYKELADVEQPSFNPETEYLQLTFRDDGDVITPVWTAVEKTDAAKESTNEVSV